MEIPEVNLKDREKSADNKFKFLTDIPKIPEAPSYELSQAQMGNWLMNTYLPQPGPFNSRIVDKIPVLDAEQAIRATHLLVERHEIFRTTFNLVDGKPRQIVHPAEDFLDAISFEESEEHSDDIIKKLDAEAVQFMFDFAKGPLFYIKIIKASDTYILLINMHHIITDAWSNTIIKQDLFQIYQALMQNNVASLPVPSIQFKDFVSWHRELFFEKLPSAFLKHWFRFSDEKYPVNNLSNRYSAAPYSVSSSYRSELEQQIRAKLKPMSPEEEALFFGLIGKVEMKESKALRFVIDGSTLQACKAIARDSDLSLFCVLLSSLQLLVYRVTQSTDSIIGVNMAMRNNIDLKNLIGFMVNTILVRNQVQSQASLIDNLKRLSLEALDAFDFNFYPFERILDDLDIPFSAVSKIFVNMPNQNEAEMTFIEDFSTKHIEDGNRIGYFDLDFHLIEQKNGIEIYCEYKKDLFDKKDIESLASHWQQLLEEIVAHPERLAEQAPIG
jgi:hypothetical protein